MTKNTDERINFFQFFYFYLLMFFFYIVRSVSLEPEDDPFCTKSNIFSGLEIFLQEDLSDSDREHFFEITLPIIAEAALNLKNLKPRNGLPFSLQQEGKINYL